MHLRLGPIIPGVLKTILTLPKLTKSLLRQIRIMVIELGLWGLPDSALNPILVTENLLETN